MPDQDDNFALLLAGAVLAGGALWLAANAYQSNEQQRSHFMGVLGEALRLRGFRLVSAKFGRGSENQGIWAVTYHDTLSQTRLQRVRLPANAEPYSDEAAHSVAMALT